PAEITSSHSRAVLQTNSVAVVPPPSSPAEGKSATAYDIKPTGSTAVIVSPQAGNKPGSRADSQKASLALSPFGDSALGVGGTGGGAGASRGTNSGNGVSGAGSVSASTGKGKG